MKTIFPHDVRMPRSLWWAALVLLLLAALISGESRAGDGGLYGPAAPPGSAFVRVFNASDTEDLSARVGNQTLADIPAWKASEFVFLPAGTHAFAAGDSQQSLSLLAGRYYTVVAGGGKLRLVDNDPYSNRLKALLILYNMTGDSGLSLRTNDGATVVIPDVATSASGSREVNPSRVQLALYKGDQKVAEAPPVTLARGQAFSLFVLGDASTPRLSWAVN